MVQLTKAQEKAEIKAIDKMNADALKSLRADFKAGLERDKIQTYSVDKYFKPLNLKGTPLSKEWLKLYDEGKFKTEADVDKFFKSKLGKEDKSKKKSLKKDIVKFGREVDDTYIFKKTFKEELNYMKEKLKEIEASIKKPSKSDKKTKGDLKKLFKEVKATKMPSAFDPEIESMKEKLKEISSLMSKPKKELKSLVKANEEHLKVFPSMKDKEEQKMTKRVLTAKSDYKRDVSNVSSFVKQYVDEYKYILDNTPTKGGAQTKKINKIRSRLYEKATPSEINDANTIIRELKKDYVKEPKPKKPIKAKAGSEDDLHDKIVKYVKGQIKKGTLESMEQGDIFYIAEEAISKGVPPRLSLKFIKTIIDE